MAQSIKLFVSLGTQLFQFNRLVEELNSMIRDGKYRPDEILMQSGMVDLKPNFPCQSFMLLEEFNQYIKDSDVIITHGGVNTIMTCMNCRKPLVIVPRQCKFGEHVDDHQLEIAYLMERKFDIIVVRDMKDLPDAIERAKKHEYGHWVSKKDELIEAVKRAIEEDPIK